MDFKEYLLTCTAEEAVETAEEAYEIARSMQKLAIRMLKAPRFGADEVQPGQLLDNMQRFLLEVADFKALCELLEKHDLIPRERVEAKHGKFEKFAEYARACGALKDRPPASQPD